MSLLFLNEDELRQIVTIPEAIACVKTAIEASARGQLNIPGSFALNLPTIKGEVDVTGVYVDQAAHYLVNVSSRFNQNAAANLPRHSGLTVLFNAATGSPAAIMLDNGYLAGLQSAAVGALAADYLACRTPAHVAVIGADSSAAYMHLKALLAVRQVESVAVWAKSPALADSYARTMVEDHNLNITMAASVQAAVHNTDLIIMAAHSQKPLLQAGWLKPGVHINAVESREGPKRDLCSDVLTQAQVIIAGNYSRCARSGELHYGLQGGIITSANVQGELGELVVGQIPGRTDPTQITLADLSTLDSGDTAVASVALEKARFYGLGQPISTQLN
jgi:ornithine cyclodeaminase